MSLHPARLWTESTFGKKLEFKTVTRTAPLAGTRDQLDRQSSPLMQRTSLGLQPIREVARTHSFAVTGPKAAAVGAVVQHVAADSAGNLVDEDGLRTEAAVAEHGRHQVEVAAQPGPVFFCPAARQLRQTREASSRRCIIARRPTLVPWNQAPQRFTVPRAILIRACAPGRAHLREEEIRSKRLSRNAQLWCGPDGKRIPGKYEAAGHWLDRKSSKVQTTTVWLAVISALVNGLLSAYQPGLRRSQFVRQAEASLVQSPPPFCTQRLYPLAHERIHEVRSARIISPLLSFLL